MTAFQVYTSYVVEKRHQHVDSGQVASDIGAVILFLMRDFRFQARHNALKVFKTSGLLIDTTQSVHPVVTIDLCVWKSLVIEIACC